MDKVYQKHILDQVKGEKNLNISLLVVDFFPWKMGQLPLLELVKTSGRGRNTVEQIKWRLVKAVYASRASGLMIKCWRVLKGRD